MSQMEQTGRERSPFFLCSVKAIGGLDELPHSSEEVQSTESTDSNPSTIWIHTHRNSLALHGHTPHDIGKLTN